MFFPHTNEAITDLLLARAIAYAEAAFNDAGRDDTLSAEGRLEALDALQHSRRVATLMIALADYFGCDRQQFGAAGVLHDVGKVTVGPAGRRVIMETISRPGSLSDKERELVRDHGPLGAQAIEDEFGADIANATALHTTYDAGELGFLEIALQAADIYDALRSPRVYKDGERHARALLALMNQAPAVSDEIIIFLAICGDAAWRDAWNSAPGLYGPDPVQLVAGLTA